MPPQDMADFEREHTVQYEENVRRAALAPPLAKRQKRAELSTTDLQIEKDALVEIGTINWVGRLQGVLTLRP